MSCFECAEYGDDERVLALVGRVDLTTVGPMKRRVRILLHNNRSGRPVIDATGLRFLDPYGARALADAQRWLHPAHQLTIRGANRGVRRVLDTVAPNAFSFESIGPTGSLRDCSRGQCRADKRRQSRGAD